MSEDDASPLVIPHRSLSAAALRGVLEAFVLREGTDYGEVEASFEDKLRQVLAQLERGEASIVFEPRSETVDIVVTRSLRRDQPTS